MPLCTMGSMNGWVAIGAFLLATTAEGSQDRENPQDVAAVNAFHERVDAYVQLHRKVAGTLPKLKETADPSELAARERDLGAAIAQARAGAVLGGIFGEELKPFFVKSVRGDWAARSPADRKAILGELPRDLKIAPNTVYPTKYPLLTMPPKLLARLPELPDELEYRLMGRHLILRDTKANIIVDAVLNVLPPLS
jgi:hypothetical protein